MDNIFFPSKDWTPEKNNPFIENGAYNSEWSQFNLNRNLQGMYGISRQGQGIFTLSVNPEFNDWIFRLSDFIQYETYYGRKVIVNIQEIKNLRAIINKALQRNFKEKVIRNTDEKWLVHSTLLDSWKLIKQSGQIKIYINLFLLYKGSYIMNIEFKRADIYDVNELINIQNQSFYADYIKYGGCPGYNHTKESMSNIVLNRITYKIICDNQIIGDIIVKDNQDSTYYLGGLCVIPDYENRGIGQEAIKFIEAQFHNATIWTLETPADKKRNHYFYKKMGYNIVKEYMDGAVKIVLFEKKMNLIK